MELRNAREMVQNDVEVAVQPAAAAISLYTCCAPAAGIEFQWANAPDSIAAAAKSPFDRSDTTCVETAEAPADSPKIMTRSGSPPKAAAFCWTHRIAARWSCVPKLPCEPSGVAAATSCPPSHPNT